MPPPAFGVLRSSLLGLEALFGRAEVTHWQEETRLVLDLGDAESMAEGYRLMSHGSAPGTLHDLIISERNGFAVTEAQEPWVEGLLVTLLSLTEAAVAAIARGGARASLSEAPAVAARFYPWWRGQAQDRPDRTSRVVYAMACDTCQSRFLLDDAVAQAAATRWAIRDVPPRIVSGDSTALVDIAFNAEADPAAQRALDEVRPAAAELGLPQIRLPYNRPRGAPDDRCPVCGADTWSPVPLRVTDAPVRFIPLS